MILCQAGPRRLVFGASWVLLGWLGCLGSPAAAVNVDLVVLPTSPACIQLENTVFHLKQKYAGRIEVRVRYFPERDMAGRHRSRLGEVDLQEMKRQTLIRRQWPGRFWKYLLARNSGAPNPVWEDAAVWARLDVPAVAERLQAFDPAAEWVEDLDFIARRRVRVVPTLLIDGIRLEGEIGLAQVDGVIAQALGECKGNVDFTLVADPRAPQPRREEAAAQIRKFIVAPVLEKADLTAEWEQILKTSGHRTLPAVVVDETFFHSHYIRYVDPETLSPLPGKGFLFPLNIVPDTLLGETSDPRTLILVQSQCPYAVDLLRQLSARYSNEEMELRYGFPMFLIRTDNPARVKKLDNKPGDQRAIPRFFSQHGPAELDEDVRQLAIQKYHPGQYWDYIRSLGSDPAQDWRAGAKAAGIEPDALNALAERERDTLLRENYQRLEKYPQVQSPTLIAQGRYVILDVNAFLADQGIELHGSCGE